MAFTYYNEIENTAPTTAEILAALTGAQKLAILDGFAEGTAVSTIRNMSNSDKTR